MPIASIRLARRYFFTATESSSGSEFRCRCRRVLINWSTPRSTPRNHRGACRRSPQSERIDWPPPYKDATEKYSSQVRLMIRLGSRPDPEITRFVMTGWWMRQSYANCSLLQIPLIIRENTGNYRD